MPMAAGLRYHLPPSSGVQHSQNNAPGNTMESKNLFIPPVILGRPAVVDDARSIAEGVTIECHRDLVPDFIDTELNLLYGSLFSSLAHFRVYGGAQGASTYVARAGGRAIAIFLYRIEGAVARVVNEWMPLDDAEATRFARFVFTQYPGVDVVAFGAVDNRLARPDFPFQAVHATEDSVLALPADAETFRAALGKATRKNVQRYLSRLQKDHPGFRFSVCDGNEADEYQLREVVRINRVRMRNKGKVPAIDEKGFEKMLKMVRATGVVGIATVDGRVCGGAITYRIGRHYYSWVRTHDPDFDDYRLGLLVGYLMICECIARGGEAFHFMWGREPHKALLLGVERTFDRVHLYRSRLHMLTHGAAAMRIWWVGRRRGLRLWLQRAKERRDLVSRAVAGAAGFLRRLRRRAGPDPQDRDPREA